MNYIGSKKKLLEFLEVSINKVVRGKNYSFSDLFAGTGIVGRYFKSKGHRVIANDLQYYSYVLNRNYIGNHNDLGFEKLSIKFELSNDDSQDKKIENIFSILQNLKPKKGFIYKNYSPGGTKETEYERMYFTDENAMLCDAMRGEIEKWRKDSVINEDEYFFLLASLLESIDKVANTASVYGAFLKKFKVSSLKKLHLEAAQFDRDNFEHEVYNSDVSKLSTQLKHDVVYLDPPYNERQYSANYHVLETIAKYDNPHIKGKTGMRDYSSQKSEYCRKNEVKESFKNLVHSLDAKYIFLSYNDEGLMSLGDIKEVLSGRGEYGVFTKKYQRFKADKTENRKHLKDSVVEYLHYVKVSS